MYNQRVTHQVCMERETLTAQSTKISKDQCPLQKSASSKDHLPARREHHDKPIPPQSGRTGKKGHLVSSPSGNLHRCFYNLFVRDSLCQSQRFPHPHPFKDPGSSNLPHSPPGTKRRTDTSELLLMGSNEPKPAYY